MKNKFMRYAGITFFAGGSLYVGYAYFDLLAAALFIVWGGYLFQKTEE